MYGVRRVAGRKMGFEVFGFGVGGCVCWVVGWLWVWV